MRGLIKRTILILLPIIVCIAGFAYSQDIKEEARKHYQIGNFYYQQGKYKEANEEFEKALDLLNQAGEESVFETEVIVPEEEAFSTEAQEQSLEYAIGVGDVLSVSVWQNPDLGHDVIVRPDGKISFPLVGDVMAAGLSVIQLDLELTERLKEYIRYPEVSVSIKKLGGKKVIVLGQVKNPGVYSVTGARTILEAVGLAGGFTDNAVSSSVILIRGGFAKPEAKRINLTRAINRGDLRQNIPLESEDIVFIPKKFISNLNYFLSQILDPISKGLYTAKEIRHW
jgi:polysaccharide export outer membrane protein